MELTDALRTTGAVREFSDQPVSHEDLAAILDVARFAPSGGNRQGWRVIVVDNVDSRRALRDAYLDAWHDYVAHGLAGQVAFSPLASADERQAARDLRDAAIASSDPQGFAENLDTVPALLVVAIDLASLSATDRDLDRYHFIGGASVYPFVWSILLAARERDLAGVLTTVGTRNEPRLRELFHIPSTWAVAAIVALGHPRRPRTRLTRRAVDQFARRDVFDGPSITSHPDVSTSATPGSSH